MTRMGYITRYGLGGFPKKLLGQKRSGQLTCLKEEISYVHLNPAPCLTSMNLPLKKSERSASAPDPSRVPYKVIKNCPRRQIPQRRYGTSSLNIITTVV